MNANFDNVYRMFALVSFCLTLKPACIFLELITPLMIFDAFYHYRAIEAKNHIGGLKPNSSGPTIGF